MIVNAPYPDPAPSKSNKPAIIIPGHYQCWRVQGIHIDYKFCEYIPQRKK